MAPVNQLTRVLLVDDDQPYREMLFQHLTCAGYVVSTAVSGRDALAQSEATKEPFDAVVLDVIMPDMDGIETLRFIRRRTPALPVIVISGGGNLGADCYLSVAKQLGAAATLAKPFHPRELVQLVAEHSGR